MGQCLDGCVRCATYAHDQYNRQKWESYDQTNFLSLDSSLPARSHNSTLHSAVIDRNFKEIRRLLNKEELNRNEENNAGETALHLACKLGYLDMADELIDGGCAVDICTSIGTPIHSIIRASKSSYLTEDLGATYIQKLHHWGCDLNGKDKGQKSAIFCAAELGSYKCMKVLITLGAKLNYVEVNRFSALYMSVIRGDLKCVNLLLEHREDLDINQRDTAGRTPLISGLITITNNFRYETLPNDYDQDAKDNMAIHKYCRMSVIESLLAAGADPNIVDNHGRSALVLAFIILELDNIHHAVFTDKCVYCLHRGQNGVISCTYGIREDSLEDQEVASETCFPNNYMNPESIYTPLVRLLVLSGACFPIGWEKDYSKSPPWLQQLYEEAQSQSRYPFTVRRPAKLIHLCRLSIRTHMANHYTLHKIDLLPIPVKLQNYLMVKYL